MALYLIDSTLTLQKTEAMVDNPYIRRFGSGYGVYCCGCDEFIQGTTINAGTYGIISIGGEITLSSSTGTITPGKKYLVPTGVMAPQPPDGHMGEVKDVFWQDEPTFAPIQGKGQPTVVNSDGWGFMFHADGKINLLDKTVCNTDYATFLIRSCSVDIRVDDSTLNPGDGVILQMIDNDDKAVGGLFTPDIFDEQGNLVQAHTGPIFNHEFFEHPGFPGIDYQPQCVSGGGKVTARFTHCSIKGDIYNATGYRNLGDGDRGQGEALELTLGQGAFLQGVVTSATSKHIDEKGRDNNLFTIDQYYYLGHVVDQPLYNGVNPISVTLTEDARWIVTGTSLLSSLTLDAQATLTAPQGKTLSMTVDGVPTELLPGSYTGEIRLTIA
jgi:hypothetical protein